MCLIVVFPRVPREYCSRSVAGHHSASLASLADDRQSHSIQGDVLVSDSRRADSETGAGCVMVASVGPVDHPRQENPLGRGLSVVGQLRLPMRHPDPPGSHSWSRSSLMGCWQTRHLEGMSCWTDSRCSSDRGNLVQGTRLDRSRLRWRRIRTVRLSVWLRADSGSCGVGERRRHSERVRQPQRRREMRRIGAAVSVGMETVVLRVCGAGFVVGERVRGRSAAGGGTGRWDRAI